MIHRIRIASIVLSCAGLLALGATVLACLQGCSAASNRTALKLLTMSTEECVKVAQAAGRKDVATACGITDSALDVLTASLADQVCTLPDAGHD